MKDFDVHFLPHLLLLLPIFPPNPSLRYPTLPCRTNVLDLVECRSVMCSDVIIVSRNCYCGNDGSEGKNWGSAEGDDGGEEVVMEVVIRMKMKVVVAMNMEAVMEVNSECWIRSNKQAVTIWIRLKSTANPHCNAILIKKRNAVEWERH